MTPATLFIADLHLSQARPDITAAFLRFMAEEAPRADALYILGDLFEFWIGDDEPNPLHTSVSEACRACVEQGTPIYFVHGNRDFLLGREFAGRAGVTLLPEHSVVELYGKPALVMHGDTLCIDDRDYQRFRRITHWPWLQWLFRRLPLSWRLKVADCMRNTSQNANQAKSMSLMDVTQLEVERQMAQYHVELLIHGHTHRPAIHQLTLDGKAARRIVLGDWYTQGSVLEVTPTGVELQTRAFEEQA
ncbi:UDP-2,3-diacylglucosamine diphosphatase [Zobellella maritima]|uniref:UDP-2,3-diacylglucosamine diphosphatase n=1 Tax=Zobellella maritima TaxID=2059725 RepID=UPI000E30AA3F|nr:UDP-2,3-diacylglucosamine diphosphatase [Zobellella maritima]